MKIAALYDIHGNLPALNAVLKELEAVQPDQVILGGDIIFGPMPRQTLERLAQLGDRVQAVRGNGDREIVMVYDGQPLHPDITEKVREEARWVAGQLTRAQRDFLAQLPVQTTLHMDGLGEVMFCHATPRSDVEIFTPVSSEERVSAIFAGIEQRMVVCGHTHMQFERQVGDVRILNAGSVGMPYADQPGAYWLLLTPQGYEFRRTAYDAEAAADEIRASGNPYAREFVEGYVLSAPTPAGMMDWLERMADSRWAREG